MFVKNPFSKKITEREMHKWFWVRKTDHTKTFFVSKLKKKIITLRSQKIKSHFGVPKMDHICQDVSAWKAAIIHIIYKVYYTDREIEDKATILKPRNKFQFDDIKFP